MTHKILGTFRDERRHLKGAKEGKKGEGGELKAQSGKGPHRERSSSALRRVSNVASSARRIRLTLAVNEASLRREGGGGARREEVR